MERLWEHMGNIVRINPQKIPYSHLSLVPREKNEPS
jgi:hypothetical protein